MSGRVPERSSRSHTSSSASWVRWPWWRGSSWSTTRPSSRVTLLHARLGQRAEDGVRAWRPTAAGRGGPRRSYMPSFSLRKARWRRSAFSCSCGTRAVGVDPVHDLLGDRPAAPSARTHGGEPGEEPVGQARGRPGRSRGGPPSPRARTHTSTCSGPTQAVPLRRRQRRSQRREPFAGHRRPARPTARRPGPGGPLRRGTGAAPTPGAAVRFGWPSVSASRRPSASRTDPVVDQRGPVADLLERLQRTRPAPGRRAVERRRPRRP